MTDSGAGLSGSRWWGALAGLLVLAALSRFLRLDAWSLSGDELFTLRDSLAPDGELLWRPLLFWIHHWLVAPFMELDELGLRLVPALAGVGSVGVLAVVGRRLVGARAALAAALLAVVSPWHLLWSQTARYYTLVFLFSALAVGALWIAVERKSRPWLATGVIAAALGFLAHPTALLPLAGFALWSVGLALARAEGRRRRDLLVGAGTLAVAGSAAALLILEHWVTLGQGVEVGGFGLVLAYVDGISTGPALAAAAGIALLWLEGRRSLAALLVTVTALPVVLLAVLGSYVWVLPRYLFGTLPFALLASGALVDRVTVAIEGRTRGAVVGGTLLLLVVATGLPGLVSHYLDGGRPDYRAVASYVGERAGPTDLALTDRTTDLAHYAEELEVRYLIRNPVRVEEAWREAGGREPAGALWVVPYVKSQGGVGIRGLGRAEAWVRDHCRYRTRIGSPRIDHQRNWLEVWRCEPPETEGPQAPDGADREDAPPRG